MRFEATPTIHGVTTQNTSTCILRFIFQCVTYISVGKYQSFTMHSIKPVQNITISCVTTNQFYDSNKRKQGHRTMFHTTAEMFKCGRRTVSKCFSFLCQLHHTHNACKQPYLYPLHL